MGEGKVVDFKDGKVLVNFNLEKEIDPNKDGEPLAGVKLNLNVWLSISELPDEALDYWKSRKDKK